MYWISLAGSTGGFIQFFRLGLSILVLGLLVGCQAEEEPTAKQEDTPAKMPEVAKPTKPVVKSTNYLFARELTDSGKIYCAASRGRKKSLALIAFKFAEGEVPDQTSVSVKTAPDRGRDCDLTMLTDEGLRDFATAKTEALFQRSVGVFLHIKVNGVPKKPRVYISQFEYEVTEDFNRAIELVEEDCAYVVEGTDFHGFQKFAKKPDCEGRKEHFSLNSPYTFSGVAKIENPPALIRCTKPSSYFPDGMCVLSTWYRNRGMEVTFSAKDMPIWRDLRSAIFEVLDKRLVALSGRYGCIGKFCSETEGK